MNLVTSPENVTPENEFVGFISDLSRAIYRRVKPGCAEHELDAACAEFRTEYQRMVLEDTARNWRMHVYRGGSVADYDEMLGILFIGLLGPLNRIHLPGINDRAKFISVYFHALDKLLNHATVRARFLHLSARLLNLKAA